MKDFKEYEVRTKELTARYKELLEREIRFFFLDSKTGELKKEIAETTRCLACDENEFTLFSKKNGFFLQRCNKCGFIFANPRPNEAVLIDFFARSEAISLYSEMVESTKVVRNDLIFKPLATYINERFIQGGKLLEVGCGSGLLLETLISENENWNVKGIEPSAKAIEICRAKGIDVFHGSLEEFKEENAYDLAIYWAVFDHFSDPFRIAKKTNSVLRSGGAVIIGNMNVDGFDTAMIGEDNVAFTPPERQNFFGIDSMRAMLERAGFRKVEIMTTGKLDVDIVRNYWSSGGKNGRSAFLEKILLGQSDVRNAFQKFLMENNLSGHMTVTAFK